MEDKVRENRLRRMAKRQGLVLRASGRRDPRALDYGLYVLTTADGYLMSPRGPLGEFGVTLDQVEAMLSGDGDARS